jgi:ABC-type sugar transport system permease subunit
VILVIKSLTPGYDSDEHWWFKLVRIWFSVLAALWAIIGIFFLILTLPKVVGLVAEWFEVFQFTQDEWLKSWVANITVGFIPLWYAVTGLVLIILGALKFINPKPDKKTVKKENPDVY